MDEKSFHYGILGIPHDASPEEVRAAYHELASLLHPDHHSNSANAKRHFQQLQASYAYLRQDKSLTPAPKKRLSYAWIALFVFLFLTGYESLHFLLS
jgi:curved DNA-binding protein CbpA